MAKRGLAWRRAQEHKGTQRMCSLDFIRLIFLVSLGAVLGSARAGVELEHGVVPGERIEGEVDPGAGVARLRFRGKDLATYAFAADQFKPYLRELRSLRGENVLRDAPADHLHHHGLMYAVRVNGVNFWEERPPAGRQVSVAPPTLAFAASPEGLPVAIVSHDLRWCPADTDLPSAALLTERRTLVFRVNPGLEEVAVEWRGRFRVGVGTPRAVIHGADYNGLGMRLPADFDHVAVFQNSAALPYSEAQTFDVRPVGWTSAAGRVHGREVMVAMAADPANDGVEAFFSMRNAFAYLAATQSLGQAPLEYPPSATFDLRFLVLVYPAHQNATFLAGRVDSWMAGR